MRNKNFIFALLLIFVVFSNPIIASGQTSGVTIEVDAGIDGYCKEGTWTPVTVIIENNGTNLEGNLIASLVSNAESSDYIQAVSLPGISKKEVMLYTFASSRNGTLNVRFLSNAIVMAEKNLNLNCVSAADLLLGVWSETPSIFNPQTSIRTSSLRADLARVSPSTIPARPEGLDMLDTLTISGVNTSQLSSMQIESIEAWVANGGRLIVTGGPDWQRTQSGLGNLLPITPDSTTKTENLSKLEELINSNLPTSENIILTTGKIKKNASVKVAQNEIPIILESEYGYGTVTYLAFDPNLEPFRAWIGLDNFYNFLLGNSLDTPGWRNGFKNWFAANEALNAVPGLNLPPFWLICGFLLLYAAIVGPVQFALLRKSKKRESAWVATPFIALVFSGVILIISANLIGKTPVINRLSIIEIWTEESSARVHGLLGVFSPERKTYDLEIGNNFLAHNQPESGPGPLSKNPQIYQTETGSFIKEVQVDAAGLKSFALSGVITAPHFEHDLEIQNPSSTNPVLTGKLYNLSQTTYMDAMILTSGTATEIGEFRASSSKDIKITLLPGTAVIVPPGSAGISNLVTDNTLADIFGTNYLYAPDAPNLEIVRRFNLLAAAINTSSGTRGNGIYLIGWTNVAPYDSNLSISSPQFADTTLYIFNLNPVIKNSPSNIEGVLILQPDQFSWSQLETTSGLHDPTPYDGFISSGSYSISYSPKDYFVFSEIIALTLNLESFGQIGPSNLTIRLWDFNQEAWIDIQGVTWGETNIPSPDRYVAENGEIRLQIASDGNLSTAIERADFSLQAKR